MPENASLTWEQVEADEAAQQEADEAARAPKPGKITVEWTETSKVTATIDIELARELFGLGGTPDDQIEASVMALLAWNPKPLLDRLASFADVFDPAGYQLLSLNGTPREDW